MRHLDLLFEEIETAVKAFPEKLWQRRGGDNMLNVPCFLAHHAVWRMVLPHLLRIPAGALQHDVEPDYAPDKPVSKEQVLALLGDIRSYASEVYGEMPNAEYLREEEKGSSALGRIMYAIAHTRHHYGQLVQILRDNGQDPPAGRMRR